MFKGVSRKEVIRLAATANSLFSMLAGISIATESDWFYLWFIGMCVCLYVINKEDL